MSENFVTLRRQTTDKAGNTRYTLDGVRASIYFNKGMFGANTAPPEVIQLSCEGLAAPGANIKPTANLAERAEKAAALAQKQADRAAKAAARNEKLQAQLVKAGLAPAPVADAPAAEPVAEMFNG